jgi:LmbE family N-acetylglucosaminyl deacetylase
VTAGGRRVLVVVAHPDDEVLGMGGTLAAHSLAGDVVRILCLTEGSSAQYPEDDVRRARKAADAQRAAAVLGAESFQHLGLPDMRLDAVPQLELNALVEQEVRTFGPDAVYVVHGDVNSDHRAVFAAVAVATRPLPAARVRRVLAFAPPSSFEWTPAALGTFVPNWFVDIGATLEQKLRAFACYETESRPYPHPRSEQALRAHAAFFGSAAGCEAAEPFALVRNLVRPR